MNAFTFVHHNGSYEPHPECSLPSMRVPAALAGRPVDRPEVVCPTSIATEALMDQVDASFPLACPLENLRAFPDPVRQVSDQMPGTGAG